MSVQADALGLYRDGSKRIVHIEEDKTRAEDWLVRARSVSENLINYRLHARTIRAEGISIPVYVVVAWRRAVKDRGGLSETNRNNSPTTA